MNTIDRRLTKRLSISKPCKVFRRGTQRYVAARTNDVSAGGASLEVESTRAVVAGERLDVGVAWSRSPIVLEDALVEARVVRVGSFEGGRQFIAVAFDVPEILPVAAA
jgi:c-di-GMP-binding flagellar brake protein YcgR